MNLTCTQSLLGGAVEHRYRVLCGRPAVLMLNRLGDPRCLEHAGQPGPWSFDEVPQTDGSSIRTWQRCWSDGTPACWIAEDRGPDLILTLHEPNEEVFYYRLPVEEAKRLGNLVLDLREAHMVKIGPVIPSSSSSHSPKPWHAEPIGPTEPGWVRDANGGAVAEVYGDCKDRVEANLALIVDAPDRIPLPEGAGIMDPKQFVAVSRARLDRLEKVLVLFVEMTRDARREDVDALLWGFPCSGCGCAESLCCCSQDHLEEP